jgi:aspartate carbamoyltransferase catalytic subunit
MSLLTIAGMDASEISRLLDLADGFVEVLDRPVPKVPALQGRTIGMLFYEASTRTRMSFERAAKALSADTMSFTPSGSSVSKGESLKDTALTVGSMGPDLFVVRHGSTGAPWRVAEWTGLPVINAGDGAHQHPTQALLDCLTLRQHFGSIEGLRVAIVGDIRHSRVARSTAQAFAAMGASVTFVAPTTLLPVDVNGWPVETTSDFDGLIGDLDVVYMLRIQQERGGGDVFPSIGEYVTRFGLTRRRADRLPAHTMVLHPGPMNRGVEIDPGVADGPRSLVTKQVANGVAVRMAVLFDQLSGAGSR